MSAPGSTSSALAIFSKVVVVISRYGSRNIRFTVLKLIFAALDNDDWLKPFASAISFTFSLIMSLYSLYILR